MSDETVVTTEDPDVTTDDELADEEEVMDVVSTPLVVPELDLEGGTKFMVGDQEYGSMAEAQEAANEAGGVEVADTEAEDEPDPETPEA